MSEENINQNQASHGSKNQLSEKSPPKLSGEQMSDFKTLFEKSFNLFKKGISKFVSLLLIPFLGYILVVASIFSFFIFKKGNAGLSIIFFILSFILVLFAIVLAFIAKTGIYLYIKDFQKNPAILDLLKVAQKKVWGFILVGFLIGVLVMLWTFLFIIPGIIFAVYYSLAYWAYIYEDKKGFSALKRSKELVKNYWWPVFSRYFMIYGLFYLLFFGSMMIVSMIFGNSPITNLWNFIIQIISILISPLFIIYSCFIYWDLKKIKG